MREITGRHVFLAIGLGFGIVIAVNVDLAVLVIRSFPMLEVGNSHVASHAFETERATQGALGGSADLRLDDRQLKARIEDADGPVQPQIASTLIGRTTQVAEDVRPASQRTGEADAAPDDLAPGISLVRPEARVEGGTGHRRRLEFRASS